MDVNESNCNFGVTGMTVSFFVLTADEQSERDF